MTAHTQHYINQRIARKNRTYFITPVIGIAIVAIGVADMIIGQWYF